MWGAIIILCIILLRPELSRIVVWFESEQIHIIMNNIVEVSCMYDV